VGAGLLEGSQFFEGAGVGALEAGEILIDLVLEEEPCERVGVSFHEFREGAGQAGLVPLGGGQFIDMVALGVGLGLPFVLEVEAKLIELVLIFAGQDDGGGIQAVAEGIEADGRLTLGGDGAGRFLGIEAVGLDL